MSLKEVNINCPDCGCKIDLDEIQYHKMEKEFQEKFNQQQAKLQKEFEKKISLFNAKERALEEQEKAQADFLKARIKEEKKAMKKKLKKELEEENEERILDMNQELKEKTEKIKELNGAKAKIEKLQRQNEELEGKMKLELQKQLNEKMDEERSAMQKQMQEESTLKSLEQKKVIEGLTKKIAELQQRATQGSMQLQGEIQEILIEEYLEASFPYDKIDEIKKGANGADCKQEVCNDIGQSCGWIYYESKNTKAFSQKWIAKFKADMRVMGADVGVLVTKALPKGHVRATMIDGVWICTIEEFKSLSLVLRKSLIDLGELRSSQMNRGDKTSLLYNFLTGPAFKQYVEGIVEGFTQMKQDLEKEKRSFKSMWKQRELQLDKVLNNTTDLYGSVRGIAGNAIGGIEQLELPAA